MRTLLSLHKSLPSPLIIVPLLGISVDVMLRLKNVKDESLKQIDASVKVGIRDVVDSRGSCLRIERRHTIVHHRGPHVKDTRPCSRFCRLA